MIARETAIVYRAGRRRFLTLRAACKAAAWAKINEKFGRIDPINDPAATWERIGKIACRYGRMIELAERRKAAAR